MAKPSPPEAQYENFEALVRGGDPALAPAKDSGTNVAKPNQQAQADNKPPAFSGKAQDDSVKNKKLPSKTSGLIKNKSKTNTGKLHTLMKSPSERSETESSRSRTEDTRSRTGNTKTRSTRSYSTRSNSVTRKATHDPKQVPRQGLKKWSCCRRTCCIIGIIFAAIFLLLIGASISYLTCANGIWPCNKGDLATTATPQNGCSSAVSRTTTTAITPSGRPTTTSSGPSSTSTSGLTTTAIPPTTTASKR